MVILTQTDTTVGFLSQDEEKLQDIKQRESSKAFIKLYKDFKTLLVSKHRVPNRFKNRVRRSKRTTYILKNRAFRVVKEYLGSQILRDSLWHYSTSANESKQSFNYEFCENNSDIIVQDKDGLKENSASTLYKMNNSKIKRIR